MTTTERTKNDMRLDDATVEAKIQNYPHEAKEPVMWLAGFLRERCESRRDILVDRVKQIGFKSVSANYFYKVLTGRYFGRDSEGRLVGSIENLVQIVDKLRAGVLLTERAGKTPFIDTTTWDRIRDYIDLKRSPETVCKFGVIIGPTGGQKTECLKHYCFLNNHGKCVHVEAPENPSMGTFLTDLSSTYGNSKWANSEVKKRDISDAVNDKKTIVIDNVQRLYRRGRGGDQPIFNYLQKLQDDTGCTIILSFAAISSNFLTEGLEKGYFEQFEGRAGGRKSFLVLDDFTPREDVRIIAEAFGIQDAKAKTTLDYLERISREPGRVRILFDALQKAKRQATATGEPLTINTIREVRGEVDK